MQSYKSTIMACYIGSFVQAIIVNTTPILFIPLREQFGLTFQQMGLLVLINFITQVGCDILFSNAIDKYGFRRFIIAAHGLSVVGLTLFAASPLLFDRPYIGFVIATIIFSGSGGLLELLLSPIVNAIPTDEKAGAMSVLHSFYSWGQAAVILLTTVLLFVCGRTWWQWIILIWTLVPLFNFFFLMRVPFAPNVPEEQRQGMDKILFNPFFIVALATILCGAAAELCISQWASAYLEEAMQLPKVIGDVGGVCLFAAMMGVGRLFYGIYGKRINVSLMMLIGTVGAAACYITVALSGTAVLSLLACGLCGLCVSLLWPGTLVVASEHYPLAGAWIFAILAAAGDIGASAGPWLMGVVAEQAHRLPFLSGLLAQGMSPDQLGLRAAMLVSALFPIIAFFCLRWMRNRTRSEI